MFEDYMRIFQSGLTGQLKRMTNPQVCYRLRNHLSSFHLDPIVGSCYLNRLLKSGDGFDQESAFWGRYVVDKFLQRMPFEPRVLEVGELFMPDGPVPGLRALVAAGEAPQEAWQSVPGAEGTPEERERGRRALAFLVKQHPSCLSAAQRILEYCRRDALDPGRYLTALRVPAQAEPAWRRALLQHYAQVGLDAKALEMWESLGRGDLDETTLNLAAEVFVRQGDRDRAVALYERSLALDKLQTPARLRLAELRAPFAPDPALVGERKVCVYLYTWNKAQVFAETLDSLSRTRLGGARIKVLLNGCTDDSRAVAEAARAKFPDNDFEIIETPVNIGAPAARNWLINHEDTWKADYTAFLDDDVTIQEDWLEQFLTVMESDQGIGVVGAKVVSPETPPRLQYLYRFVDLATDEMFKMSLEAPISEYDVGLYDYVRPARSVMGCQHLFRTEALRQAPQFDIRFSPSQVDDIEHDLQLCLKGFKVMYTGLVTCIHHQSSGVGQQASSMTLAKMGNALGNDLKLCFKHVPNQRKLARMDGLGLVAEHVFDPLGEPVSPARAGD